jgi:hypothetical protein
MNRLAAFWRYNTLGIMVRLTTEGVGGPAGQAPSQMARERWEQTKAAATAGASAWRNGPPSSS